MSGKIEQRRAGFIRWMADNGLKVPDVAKAARVPSTTLYSYVGGKAASMRGDTQEKIATAFSVPLETIFSIGSHSKRELGVWGKIGARAEVYPLSDYDDAPMYEVGLPPTLDPGEDFVAFEIEGFSMPPAEPGWLAVFRRTEAHPDDLINTPCLVDTADGRRLFKKLRKGYTPGRYNLESWDGSPLIEDVEIRAVLPFAALSPGRHAR